MKIGVNENKGGLGGKVAGRDWMRWIFTRILGVLSCIKMERDSNTEIVCFHMGKIDGVLFAKQRLG